MKKAKKSQNWKLKSAALSRWTANKRRKTKVHKGPPTPLQLSPQTSHGPSVPLQKVELKSPKPLDKVEFILPEFSTKSQPPMKKHELKFEVLSNHLKNTNIRARGTPHLKKKKLIMLLHEYMKEIGWVKTKTKGVLHFLLNSVGTWLAVVEAGKK